MTDEPKVSENSPILAGGLLTAGWLILIIVALAIKAKAEQAVAYPALCLDIGSFSDRQPVQLRDVVMQDIVLFLLA